MSNGPGIDVRGDGGYVIAPPSRHASGRLYRWDVALGDLPELPGWLRDQMATPRHPQRMRPTEPIRIDEALSAWARAALEGEAMQVRSAPHGSRNATLNRAAFCLGQIVGARVLDASLVERVLGESAITSGLGERESLLTIRSGLRAGMDHPRGPRERALPSLPPSVRPSPSSDVGLDVSDTL